jgi:hypothetical protein
MLRREQAPGSRRVVREEYGVGQGRGVPGRSGKTFRTALLFLLERKGIAAVKPHKKDRKSQSKGP